jgi:hypothetical protein
MKRAALGLASIALLAGWAAAPGTAWARAPEGSGDPLNLSTSASTGTGTSTEATSEEPREGEEAEERQSSEPRKRRHAQAKTEPGGEKAKPEPPRPKKPGQAGLDLVIGFGKQRGLSGDTPFTAYSLLFGGGYRFGDVGVGLRFPVTSATVENVASGAKSSQSAVGNLELGAAYYAALSEGLELPVGLRLALPTAGGDPAGDLAAVRLALVQQVAAGSRGLEDNALFLPKHFGMTPYVGVEWESGRLRVWAHQKFEMLIRAGAQNPPAGEARGLGFTSITSVAAACDILRHHLWGTLRFWGFGEIAEPYESPAGGPSKFQAALEPQVGGRVGPLLPALGFIAPLGGRLGDPGMKGLRLSVFAEF